MTASILLASIYTLGMPELMFIFLAFVPALIAAIHCLRNNRMGNNAKALWLLGIVLVSPLGAIVYAFSGEASEHVGSPHA